MAAIRDVAKLAGVSTSTVSRALSGKIFVEPDTKIKIIKAVQLLQYHPNPLAKGLKEGRTNILGLIIPDISTAYFSVLVKSMEKYAAQNGYAMLLANTNEDSTQEQTAIRIFRERCVDGLAIIAMSPEMGRICSLRSQGMPFVLVNRWSEEDINCVSNDQRWG